MARDIAGLREECRPRQTVAVTDLGSVYGFNPKEENHA